MKIYIETSDGSVVEWHGSLTGLEDHIFSLLRQGQVIKVKVL